MKANIQFNVLGERLITCSKEPMTGFKRNGCCESYKKDFGKHLICAVLNKKFLDFQFSKGNDLITPNKEFEFPGLKPQDKWCVCAARWIEAYNHSCETSIVLASTHIDVLKIIDFKILKKFAIDLN